MAELTLMAERHDESKLLPLRMAWIDGGNDDVEFSMECGAGLGSPVLCVTVETRGVRVTEVIDIRDGLKAWVNRIVDEIEAELAS